MDKKEDERFAFCETIGFMVNKTDCDECFMKCGVSCKLREKMVFDQDFDVNKISDEVKNIFILMKKQSTEIQEKILELEKNNEGKGKKEGNNKKRHN